MTQKQSASNVPELAQFFYYGQWKGAAETISGKGSTLAYTKLFRLDFEEALSKLGVSRLLDAPCGDFNWMKEVNLASVDYIGMDIVADIVSENAKKYGNESRHFLQGDITSDPLPSADLMLVRDCLFHLPFAHIARFFENFLKSEIAYLAITSNVTLPNQDLATPGMYRHLNLLIEPFNLPRPPTNFVLRDYPEGATPKRFVYIWSQDQVRKEMTPTRLDAMTSWVVRNPASKASKHDSYALRDPDRKQLENVLQAHPHFPKYLAASSKENLLLEVVGVSLENLGFYTKHAPRAFEYPWILSNIPMKADTVVDIGAGLSPVPFILAQRGCKVVTVDNSEIQRSLSGRANGTWNEWGFLDYSLIQAGIESHNIDFGLLRHPAGTVDSVYSISVVEHMPAVIRRRVVAKAADLLKPSGTLVLTLDLVPGTLLLWNKAKGKIVEPPELHGTLPDFLKELESSGLLILSIEIERALPGAATDICCLIATKK